MTSRTEEQICFRPHLLDAVARRSPSERADELLSDAGVAIGWNDVIESSRSARHEWRIAGRVANCDMSVAARTARRHGLGCVVAVNQHAMALVPGAVKLRWKPRSNLDGLDALGASIERWR